MNRENNNNKSKMEYWENKFLDETSDIEIEVEGKTYKTHKHILLISPVLRNMLSGKYSESMENKIMLDIKKGTWENLMRILYESYNRTFLKEYNMNCKITFSIEKLSIEELIELHILVDMYMYNTIKKKLNSILRNKLNLIYEYIDFYKCININQKYIDNLYFIDTIIEILQDNNIVIPENLFQPLVFDTVNKKIIYNNYYKDFGNLFYSYLVNIYTSKNIILIFNDKKESLLLPHVPSTDHLSHKLNICSLIGIDISTNNSLKIMSSENKEKELNTIIITNLLTNIILENYDLFSSVFLSQFRICNDNLFYTLFSAIFNTKTFLS